MDSEAGIRRKYKEYHDLFSWSFYSGTSGLTKEQFDLQHGQIWANMEADLIAAGFLVPAKSPRDLGKEIDELKVRVKKLEPV